MTSDKPCPPSQHTAALPPSVLGSVADPRRVTLTELALLREAEAALTETDLRPRELVAELHEAEDRCASLEAALRGMIAWAALFNGKRVQVEQAPAVKTARAALAQLEQGSQP